MNINNFLKGMALGQQGKTVDPDPIAISEPSYKPQSKFSFLVFGCVTAGVLGTIGTLNYLVDPLWYSSGNRLTGENFPFNERISKTNLFLRSNTQDYDCLIVGSSRVIALNSSEFK
ncbi:MAG TPA: hypothetical protein VIQ31_33770 [Phormidium sp.]